MPRPFLFLVIAAFAAAAAAGTARAATSTTIAPQVSSNWSGYALVPTDETTPLTFSDVTGTWKQPKASCTLGRSSSSAFWVGLGGYAEDSTALEQLGTGADCNGNTTTPSYYAWWELVPASSVQIPLKIKPGDTITAAVLVQGQTITFFLHDLTSKARFSKKVTTAQTLDVSSAEWIAEAPSDCGASGRCRVVPLTNFGTVTFTNIAATETLADGTSHSGTLTDPGWSAAPIELIAGGHAGFFGFNPDPSETGVGAVPGDASTDGRTFSVRWAQNLTAPSQ
ncbi:MAG TPA: G1 family glutamic endopeptidase [Gaiellaceae bacterium]|nr:G1 family glutamic endopeptidase [Gaiellaceae bacterium]